MSKSQIWLIAFVGVFVVLFVMTLVLDKGEPSGIPTGMPDNGNPGQSQSDQSALSLIKANGCMSCHGGDLKGTNLAPSLIEVKNNWKSRDELISYLRNPSSFMDKDRFKDYRNRYSSTMMPPFNNLDIKNLGKIADYIMGL